MNDKNIFMHSPVVVPIITTLPSARRLLILIKKLLIKRILLEILFLIYWPQFHFSIV